MLERVARAICTAAGIDPDGKSHEPEHDFRWQDFLKEARAAIAAMRDPTDAMCFAAGRATGNCVPFETYENAYRAMIDASLSQD